jgi:hypothetical protein
MELDFLIFKERSSDPFTYRSIRLTAARWIVDGECKNWHTLFT